MIFFEQKIKNLILYFSIFLNLIIVIILFTPLTEQLYKPLIFNQAPVKSQVIVILSGGHYKSDLPGFRNLVRIRKGLELYRKKYAPKIICSGGILFNSVSKKPVAKIMKETLLLYGVPERDILTEESSENTYYNIKSTVNQFKKDFDFNKSLVVTSSYHTLRASLILKKNNIGARVISADPFELYPKVWSERIDFFREVVREYMAICYFWLRDWI